MAVTLQEIADRCNVSRVTVSHVLRNPDHPRYAQTTKELVLQVADELQYSPNLVARSLKRGKTNLLGVIIPFNDPGVIDRIEYIAQELGYAVMVQFSPVPNEDAEVRALKSAIDRKVDGIIWQPCSTASMSQDTLKMIQSARIPVVQMQTRIPHFKEADYVGIDWKQAIDLAVGHLQAGGYDRIVYVTQPQGAYEPRGERIQMFEQSIAARGAAGELLVTDTATIEDDTERFLRQCPGERIGFFGQGVQLTAVVATAQQCGRCVPDEVGVLLLGDLLLGGKYFLSELTAVKLSVIQMPEMAHLAMRTLVDRIAKRKTGVGTALIKDATLVQRDSTVAR